MGIDIFVHDIMEIDKFTLPTVSKKSKSIGHNGQTRMLIKNLHTILLTNLAKKLKSITAVLCLAQA